MLIGVNGALSTTLLAAQAALDIGLDLSFALPSESIPEFNQLGLINQTDVVYAGWDILSDLPSHSCAIHKVVPAPILEKIGSSIDQTTIYPAILIERGLAVEGIMAASESADRNKSPSFSTSIFSNRSHREMIQSLDYDINDFQKTNGCDSIIIVNLSSIEPLYALEEVHQTLKNFEKGLDDDDPSIHTAMIYAYAAATNHCHYINFTPSVSCEVPAIIELSEKNKIWSFGLYLRTYYASNKSKRRVKTWLSKLPPDQLERAEFQEYIEE